METHILTNMQTLDIIVLAILVIMTIIGLVRGLVRQLGDLVALVAGVIGANLWGKGFTAWIEAHTEWSLIICQILAYIALFLAIYLSIRLIAHFIKALSQLVRLGWLDSIAGGIFSAFKTILFISLLLNLAMAILPDWEIWKSPLLTQSMCYETLKGFALLILDALNSYGIQQPSL